MLTIRIIPCLDVSHGRVVKGIKFQGLRDAGDPADLGAEYERQGADELVFLDISATHEERDTQLETVRRVRERMSIPVTVGGGVRTVEDARLLLEAGADKVSVNTAAVLRPELITEISERFGRQCMVVAVDARSVSGGSWEVVISGGRQPVGVDALVWLAEAERRGAGEFLLTSWDRDGTRSGYDLDLLRAASETVQTPIIASGGASSALHLAEALRSGASAVLAASIFHDGDVTVREVKAQLRDMSVHVRL